MTRIIERRQDAAPDEEVFELRVFQLRDGDVRACVVPADLAVNLDMMADMSEPVAQAISTRLRCARRKALRPYGFTIRSVSFRHSIDRSWNCDESACPPRQRSHPTLVEREGSRPLGDRRRPYRLPTLRARWMRLERLIRRVGQDAALPA
jgi:hypothetical protein